MPRVDPAHSPSTPPQSHVHPRLAAIPAGAYGAAMKRFGPILAAVAVLLASLSLGAARGQVLSDGQIVLCSGSAVTVQVVDASGRPVRHPSICPDMALALMSAVAAPAILLPAPASRSETLQVAVPQAVPANAQRPRQGRGPPILLA